MSRSSKTIHYVDHIWVNFNYHVIPEEQVILYLYQATGWRGVPFPDKLQNLDFNHRLSMKFLLVANDLHCIHNLPFMIPNSESLSERAVTQFVLDFVSIGNVIVCNADVIPTIIIIPVIQRVILIRTNFLSLPAEAIDKPIFANLDAFVVVQELRVLRQYLFYCHRIDRHRQCCLPRSILLLRRLLFNGF